MLLISIFGSGWNLAISVIMYVKWEVSEYLMQSDTVAAVDVFISDVFQRRNP